MNVNLDSLCLKFLTALAVNKSSASFITLWRIITFLVYKAVADHNVRDWRHSQEHKVPVNCTVAVSQRYRIRWLENA